MLTVKSELCLRAVVYTDYCYPAISVVVIVSHRKSTRNNFPKSKQDPSIITKNSKVPRTPSVHELCTSATEKIR